MHWQCLIFMERPSPTDRAIAGTGRKTERNRLDDRMIATREVMTEAPQSRLDLSTDISGEDRGHP